MNRGLLQKKIFIQVACSRRGKPWLLNGMGNVGQVIGGLGGGLDAALEGLRLGGDLRRRVVGQLLREVLLALLHLAQEEIK